MYIIYEFFNRNVLLVGSEGVAAEFETKWIGWPGVDVYDVVEEKALSKSLAEIVRIEIHELFIYLMIKFSIN